MTYDGRLGSTGELATFMAQVLTEHGATVDVRPVRDAGTTDAYDLVVVGSAIRYDRWLPDAINFVREHKDSLRRQSVAYFFTCLTLATRSPKTEAKADAYAVQLRTISLDVQPISVGQFGGVLNFKTGPWHTRILLRLLSRLTGVRQGDYRDWEAVREWTQAIISDFDASNPCGA